MNDKIGLIKEALQWVLDNPDDSAYWLHKVELASTFIEQIAAGGEAVAWYWERDGKPVFSTHILFGFPDAEAVSAGAQIGWRPRYLCARQHDEAK